METKYLFSNEFEHNLQKYMHLPTLGAVHTVLLHTVQGVRRYTVKKGALRYPDPSHDGAAEPPYRRIKCCLDCVCSVFRASVLSVQYRKSW